MLAEVEQDGKKLRKFSMVAYTGAAMNVPGFFRPVVVDLAGLSVPSQRLPILRQHDSERIVAHSEDVELSAQRLKVGGLMSGVGEAAGEVLSLATNGFPWQASIGASVESKEFVDAGQTVKVNGRNMDGPLIVARKATLREISFVPLGADPGTSAKVAAGMGGIDMQFNDWLTKNGFEPDKVTAAQRVALEAAWKAENASPPPVPTPTPAPAKPAGSRSLNDTLNAQRIREQHEERIESNLRAALDGRRITANDAVEIQIEAFADPDKWDDNRLELEFIRRERPKGPGIMVSREPQLNEKVIECAVSLCASLTNVERHYDEQTIDAARKRWPRGLTMVDMAATVARKNGYRGDTFKNNIKEVLRAAVQPDIRAGHAGPSTYSIPNILSNVAGKAALEGFYATEMVWSSVASRRSVTDFKQITSLRPTGDLIYQRLAPGGEIEHGSVGERAYTNQAHTYARMIGISREDWINDDTGALGGTSREMGVGAGDAVNDRFWTVFMNNTGSFFVAGNNNVSTGVFSLANLGEAQRVFKLQTKPNGRPLGLEPAILLVPVALEVAALNAINSTIVVATNTGTATTLTPNGNVLANKYQVLASAYLSNTSYTGNSAVAYYILAAPSRLSVIEGVFLNGVETPTVETADFDWNMLGTSMRGYLDFGFALQEFRAGVRSTGA